MLAETCVFDKQSHGPLFCGRLTHVKASNTHVNAAPLIPKLRGQFVEFLNDGSLERLRILISPTCVSFSTGTCNHLRGFSWTCFKLHPDKMRLEKARSAIGADLPTPAPGYPNGRSAARQLFACRPLLGYVLSVAQEY